VRSMAIHFFECITSNPAAGDHRGEEGTTSRPRRQPRRSSNRNARVSPTAATRISLDPNPEAGRFALRVLAGRNLLFSEARQAIYDLNDVAAYVWQSLEEGLRPDAMVAELVAAGGNVDDARSAVHGSLERFSRTRLIAAEELASRPEPTGRLPSARRWEPTGHLESRTLEISGVIIRLHLSPPLLDIVDEIFGHLRSEPLRATVELCATTDERRVWFAPMSGLASSCHVLEFAPLLKAQLIDEVLRSAVYEVALHAAALVRHDRALLLVGRPGAGKTTLSFALARSGFDLAADDVVLMRDGGLVSGLPFAAAAKGGAWKLVARYWPNLLDCPVYRRPDGKLVRYLVPGCMASPLPRRVGWIALLDRRSHGAVSIDDVDPVAALRALIDGGTARDDQMSTTGFTSLVSALSDVRCYRITYADLGEATDRLLELCS
jgi:hypothetical protein